MSWIFIWIETGNERQVVCSPDFSSRSHQNKRWHGVAFPSCIMSCCVGRKDQFVAHGSHETTDHINYSYAHFLSSDSILYVLIPQPSHNHHIIIVPEKFDTMRINFLIMDSHMQLTYDCWYHVPQQWYSYHQNYHIKIGRLVTSNVQSFAMCGYLTKFRRLLKQGKLKN